MSSTDESMTNQSASMEWRVRYAECDPMGVAHHTAYPVWFEMGRTELLRTQGGSYAELERMGALLVVVRLNVRYRSPARYDDMLRLETSLTHCGQVKIEHSYRLWRGHELLTNAETTLACVDRQGRPQQVPEMIRDTSTAS